MSAIITNKQAALYRQVVADLDRHEGFRTYAYPDPLSALYRKYPHLEWGFKPAREIAPPGINWDSGKPWTVGFGDTHGVTPDHQTDRHKAERRLTDEVQEIDQALGQVFYWYKDEASFVTKTIMINMVYNMGLKGFLGFKNTIRYIKEKNYKQAAANMRKSLWAQQTGRRAAELARRMETQEIPSQWIVPESNPFIYVVSSVRSTETPIKN